MSRESEELERMAAEIHASAIVVDGHADTVQRFADEGWEFTGPSGAGMLSLEAARRGGLHAEFFAAWAEPVEWRGRYAERTMALLEAVRAQVRRHPGELRLCLTAEDVRTAGAEGRFGVLLAVEGGHSIENDLAWLRRFYELGARYMTLTWSNTSEWADSSGDLEEATVRHHGGLTEFGREVVAEMNRLGMMVDVSHVSDATLADVLEASRVPVIASHSSARALTDSRRNLTDEQLRAIADGGGVVMVNFYPAFVDEGWRAGWNGMRVEREAAQAVAAKPYRERGEPVPFSVANKVDRVFAGRLQRPPLSVLVDHIDHVAQVAGVEAVGLGSDFDGIPVLPEEMESAADLPKVTVGMMGRGYATTDVRKMLGENVLRVFDAVRAASFDATR